MAIENVVIIGSGPAGHTAAIYAARANMNPLMFEGFMAGGVAPGGQRNTTTAIANIKGFVSNGGPEKMVKMREQAIHCGTRIRTETVTKVDFSKRPFKIWAEDDLVEARTVILATGATAKRMFVPGEEALWQRGISACAVCDGALPLFRNQPLVVVGGGDTAVEEATHLTKFGSKVYLVHRRDSLRASKAMQQRAFNNAKIEMVWDTLLVDAEGKDSLERVKLQNVKSGKEHFLDAKGLFYAIGHTPNTAFLECQIKTDEMGYIVTEPGSTRTSVRGVFAAGDVQDKRYRQAVTSAGTGCMAALDAEHFLQSEEAAHEH